MMMMATPNLQQQQQQQPRIRQETPEYKEMIERDRQQKIGGNTQAFVPGSSTRGLPQQQYQPQQQTQYQQQQPQYQQQPIERPRIDLTSLAVSVPQIVEFIRIAKLANKSRGRPDTLENTTQCCLALFHILAENPLESYEKLDLSGELASVSDQITKANKALLALREWSKSLKNEASQIRQFIEHDVAELTSKVEQIVGDIENQKSNVLDKYKEAMAQIVNCTEDLATDSELTSQENADASQVFSWSNIPQDWIEPSSLPKPEAPVDASVDKPKFIAYQREEFGGNVQMTPEALQAYEAKFGKKQMTNAEFDLPKNVGVQRTDLSTMFKGPTDKDLERLKIINAEAKENNPEVLAQHAGREEPKWLKAISSEPGKDPYDNALGFHKEDIKITTIDPNLKPPPVELKIAPQPGEKQDGEPATITPVPPLPPAANLKPRRKKKR